MRAGVEEILGRMLLGASIRDLRSMDINRVVEKNAEEIRALFENKDNTRQPSQTTRGVRNVNSTVIMSLTVTPRDEAERDNSLGELVRAMTALASQGILVSISVSSYEEDENQS